MAIYRNLSDPNVKSTILSPAKNEILATIDCELELDDTTIIPFSTARYRLPLLSISMAPGVFALAV